MKLRDYFNQFNHIEYIKQKKEMIKFCKICRGTLDYWIAGKFKPKSDEKYEAIERFTKGKVKKRDFF
jgi:hypothetical protein